MAVITTGSEPVGLGGASAFQTGEMAHKDTRDDFAFDKARPRPATVPAKAKD